MNVIVDVQNGPLGPVLDDTILDQVNITTTSVTIRCISKASKVIQKNVKIPGLI